MHKKIVICLLALMMTMALLTGCMEWENIAPSRPEQTPPTAETETPVNGEEQPGQTPSPEPTPAVTPTPTPTPEPKDLPTVIGEHLGSVPSLIMNENNTSGSVEPEETFAVALEENVSTGYLWQWEGEAACVLDTRWQPETGMVGAPGTHIWAFKVSEPGEYTLDFTLVAPDGGVGDVRSMTVTVH